MKFRIIILLILLGGCLGFIYAQEGQKINVMSPNTESFKIYGDIPVSLYTGIPQISIPLHTIEMDFLNLDLSLNYHASGFKPEMHPSWVGLGWNLNVGGVITREVKNIPDENNSLRLIMGCNDTPGGGIGFYYSYDILNNDKWYLPENDIYSTNNKFGARNIDIDRQPDVFSFNFLGYSGKFYLNHKREWKVQCDAPIKVLFDESDIGKDEMFRTSHFRKFTIIDDKGVKYIFGGDNAIEYTGSMFPCNDNYESAWIAVSWYLKEIIPPVGEVIRFNYERGPFQSNFSCSGNYPAKWRSGEYGSREIAHNYVLKGVSGSLTSPVLLTSIDCPSKNLKITFETSKSNDLTYFETNYTDFFYYTPQGIAPNTFLAFDAAPNIIPFFDRNPDESKKASINSWSGKFKDKFIWLKLNTIRFTYSNENDETESKSINFVYHENEDIRRKLSSINITYPSSTSPEVYSFEYSQSLPYGMDKEPEYLSELADHWGYANNKFLWVEPDRTNGPKAAIGERAKLGVLSKIIYPTKGQTLFIYENNDYGCKVENSNGRSTIEYPTTTITGGLRIKKIINLDGIGKYTLKEYIYTKVNRDTRSSGVLHSKPVFYSSNGLLFDNSGAHVGYSAVIEKREDRSFKASNFISEDYFTRLGEDINSCVDDPPIYFGTDWYGTAPYSSRYMERGKVSDEYYCDSLGKVYKSIHYSYVNIGKDISNYVRTADRAYMTLYAYVLGGGAIPDQAYSTKPSAHYYYCYSNKLSNIREILYNGTSSFTYGNSSMPPLNTIIVNKKTFEYDKLGQLSKESSENSTGNNFKRTIKYPYDDLYQTIHKQMVDSNMVSYPIFENDSVNNILQKGTKYNYSLINKKHILLTSIKDLYKDNTIITRSEFSYNILGKLVENRDYTGLNQTYLWDYNGRKIKAVLSNTTLSDISANISKNVIDCSAPSTNWVDIANTMKVKYPYSQMKSYDYNSNGSVKKIINENGLTTNYIYDANERLQSIKDDDQRIIQDYSYNYKENPMKINFYLNNFTTLSASRICPAGYVSEGSVSLDIPSGSFMSTISEEDANKKARDKYQPELQLQANYSRRCIISREIELLSTNMTNLATYRAHQYGDDLIIDYIYLYWTTEFQYSTYNAFYDGIRIAEIKDKSVMPQDYILKEFEISGNKWVMWINHGSIYIMLKEAGNPNAIPRWQEGFQVSGGASSLIFPLIN